MKWHVEKTGKPGESLLVLTVTDEEKNGLIEYRRRSEAGELDPGDPRFETGAFMVDMMERMVTDDEYQWIPDGVTADMTSAPMLGILGDEMPGPPCSEADGSGLVHVGRWEVDGRLREMYQPVLRRWAFMNYAITSPQAELAAFGRTEFQGGDYIGDNETARKMVAEWESAKK